MYLGIMNCCRVWMNVSTPWNISFLLDSYDKFFKILMWAFSVFILQTVEIEEITCYSRRINSRLSTIELCVRTVRDTAQEESLHQVNSLIDSIITNSDRCTARQRCQTFLNGCSFAEAVMAGTDEERMVDKKFENTLLGCTLDDQKVIKKRLQALMTYMNKQTISDWMRLMYIRECEWHSFWMSTFWLITTRNKEVNW